MVQIDGFKNMGPKRRVEIHGSKWTGQNRWVLKDRSKYTGPNRRVKKDGFTKLGQTDLNRRVQIGGSKSKLKFHQDLNVLKTEISQ